MSKKYIDTDTAYEVLTKYYHHHTPAQHAALREALDRVPEAETKIVRYWNKDLQREGRPHVVIEVD